MLRAFYKNEDGATAIEYGLIASLVCIAIIGGVTSFGTQLNTLWTNTAATILGA